MSKETIKCLNDCTPINKRILKARFCSKYTKLVLAYAPTNDADEQRKEDPLDSVIKNYKS